MTAASISAAQNEYESFQVIARAPANVALVGVNGYATDLTGPGGTLPSANIVLYREQYVRVTTPSPGSPYPPDYWPDALIPFLNPETGQPLSGGRIPSAPFDVPMGTNQPIFVEVYVPPGTAPGVYTGSVVMSATVRSSTAVPVTLQVRNFALPQRASLRSDFTPYGQTSNAANYFGLPYGSADRAAMTERFNSFLLAHRLNSDQPNGSTPYVFLSTGHIDTTDSYPLLRHYFEDLHATGWSIPFGPNWPWPDPTGADRDKAVTYLTEMANYLTANGWFNRSYVYLYDEPNSAAAYSTIRDVAALIHSVRGDYRVLITEQPQPQEPSWGSLSGAVDIWVPLFSLFDEPSASAAIANGNEVWAYAEGSASPQWLIDFPLINYRVPSWIEWRYGQTGLLYWTPWYWEQTNPWDSTATDVRSYATFNDSGMLVYPGNDVGYLNGPIASIRLKALRDGMEDYEYLKLLSDMGDANAAAAEALGIGTSWQAWDRAAVDLEAARDRLASRIEALMSIP
ncbi:MAG: glycoside hydrolase domain-containing protein [Candidatus Binatia bacterium]